MARAGRVSRRTFLAGVAGITSASRLALAAASDGDAPSITRKVEKLFKVTGSTQPNDLQFVPEGLWVLDQKDPNKAFLVKPEDGAVLRALQTDSIHGSGITFGNGALWITSTKMVDPKDPPRTLKVDPMTGKTLKSWVTPGSGYYGAVTAEKGSPSGGHGIKWADGKYWMAVPAASKLFLMEPESGAIIRSIPGPGTTQRTHGIAIESGALWCINSDDYAIYKLNPEDGRVIAKIQLSKTDPAPHGLDIDARGNMWYCDAGSQWICRLA
jgi:streptogramin lyase